MRVQPHHVCQLTVRALTLVGSLALELGELLAHRFLALRHPPLLLLRHDRDVGTRVLGVVDATLLPRPLLLIAWSAPHRE